MVLGDGNNVQNISKCTIEDSEGNSINLAVQNLSHGMDKQLMIFPIPQKGGSDTKTYLIDLQRCKEAMNITSFIVDQSTWTVLAGNYGLKTPPTEGTTGTPLAQLKILIDMMRGQNDTLTLKWGADVGSSDGYETITGSIQKVDIKEMPGTLMGYNPNFVDNAGTGVCSDTDYTTQSSCVYHGSCSDAQYNNKSSCEQAGEDWTANTWDITGAENRYKAWHKFYQVTFVFVRGQIKN